MDPPWARASRVGAATLGSGRCTRCGSGPRRRARVSRIRPPTKSRSRGTLAPGPRSPVGQFIGVGGLTAERTGADLAVRDLDRRRLSALNVGERLILATDHPICSCMGITLPRQGSPATLSASLCRNGCRHRRDMTVKCAAIQRPLRQSSCPETVPVTPHCSRMVGTLGATETRCVPICNSHVSDPTREFRPR